MGTANFIANLRRALPASGRRVLRTLTACADERGLSLYLVGGAVRDLILGRATLDVDLTLEGDAAVLARLAAGRLRDARCVVHSAFGTATLRYGRFRIDVATARAETYERPGALPDVRAGSLTDDLFRRDFTVNAMALELSGPRTGEIIDPFAGRADLDAGLIRVLHEGSFRDDATRVLRAARYEQRLDFHLEPDSERWLRRDAHYLDAISGARVRDELVRCLREQEPERILSRLHDLGALRAIHPALSFGREKASAFTALRSLAREPSVPAYLALLAWDLSPAVASALADRLALDKRETDAVVAAARLRGLEGQLRADMKPSRAVDLLSAQPTAAVWALAAAGGEPARHIALLYLRRWRHVQPSLNGHDLQVMGMPPGPEIGQVLRRLKAARLDGEVRSRKQEEQIVRAHRKGGG